LDKLAISFRLCAIEFARLVPAEKINKIGGSMTFPSINIWRFAERRNVFLQIEIFPATPFIFFSSEGA